MGLVKTRYKELSLLDADIWRQRAKLRWELEGDKGSKYFHSIASRNKRANHIPQIKHQGTMYTDHKTKADTFFSHFVELMGKQPNQMPHIHWPNLYATQHDLSDLQNIITEEEIKQVIKAWPSNKSPGPDGFTGEFYKKFAQIIIPDLIAVYNHITLTNTSLSPLNNSYIILMPKEENATEPHNYRPISLVNGIQKIFSKILAYRLQLHIDKLIDNSQTGFMKGRQIVEGFLYAQHILHISHQQNIPLAIFKADIQKAFDTLIWEFLLKVMTNIGFPSQWTNWIENAVLKGTSQTIINGLLGKNLTLRRGVRQGDPLSPFLSILAIDFLPRWFNKLKSTGAIRMPIETMKPCLL